MAEKRTHNAHLNAKGLEDFVGEDAARAMAESQGDNSIFIVRAQHGRLTRDVDGSERINLTIGTVALVPPAHEPVVRRLLVALALDTGADVTLDLDADGAAPSVEDAAAEVDAAAVAAGGTEEWDPTAKTEGEPTADTGAAAAADPDAPLPAGDQPGEGEGPWPGDEGYEAPGTEPSEPAPAGDDLATARAKATRKAASGK